MRNHMIIGAGSSYVPDVSGGSLQHNHNFTADGHDHNFGGGTDLVPTGSFAVPTRTNPLNGSSDNTANLPRYYSLAYIMNLGV